MRIIESCNSWSSYNLSLLLDLSAPNRSFHVIWCSLNRIECWFFISNRCWSQESLWFQLKFISHGDLSRLRISKTIFYQKNMDILLMGRSSEFLGRFTSPFWHGRLGFKSKDHPETQWIFLSRPSQALRCAAKKMIISRWAGKKW